MQASTRQNLLMNISIKAAAASDASLIARLNRDVQELHAQLEPTFFKAAPDAEELIAFFAAKMSSPESHILIASIAAEPAGYVWFDVQDRPATPLTLPRRRIYIHHLSVQAGARRQGLATMLMKHVEDEALALGIRTIALDTWAANSSARSFFSGRGFEPFNVSLSRQLP